MTKKFEEVQDELQSLITKRDKAIVEANKYQKEIESMTKTFYDLNPDYVKGECPTCMGTGIVQGEDEKKIVCPICRGDCFIFLKVFKEK